MSTTDWFIVALAVDCIAWRVILGRTIYWQKRLIETQRTRIALLEAP